MNALLLTNYYLVYRSLLMYAGIALLASALILHFGDASLQPLAAMLAILFLVMPALEVIKHEGKSGYDKFVLTLPVTRRKVVSSHYIFYFLVVLMGTLLSVIVFYLYGLITSNPINNIISTVSTGTFIVMIAGSISYPLLYTFGSEKSDAITIGGAGGALLAMFGLESLASTLVENNIISFELTPSSLMLIYLGAGIIVYGISFIISTWIYSKKEF